MTQGQTMQQRGHQDPDDGMPNAFYKNIEAENENPWLF